MTHESSGSNSFEQIELQTRVDVALTSAMTGVSRPNYELALISDDRTFSDVVFRGGLPVKAMVLFALDPRQRAANTVSGYVFESAETGWEVQERLGGNLRVEDIKFRKLPYLTDEHVQLLEHTLGSSRVVGFSTLNPSRQQQLEKIRRGIWNATATTLATWANKAAMRAALMDDRSNNVPGVKSSRSNR